MTGKIKLKFKDTNTPNSVRVVGKVYSGYYDDYEMILKDDKHNMKKRATYIKGLKSYIRGSDHYRRLMKFLKKSGGLDVCAYHHNIKDEDGFKLEVHHAPFGLENICNIILRKRAMLRESLKYSDCANEIMKLHYLKLIGLVPFCETCHEFNHDEGAMDTFIPDEGLFGDVKTFIEMYRPFMPEMLSIKADTWLNLDKHHDIIKDRLPEQLMKHYLYVTDDNGATFIDTELYIQLLENLSR
jgi:hypothetical protein